MSFLDALNKNNTTKIIQKKDKNLEKVNNEKKNEILQSDYEYFDEKYNMFLFDVYFDIVDEMKNNSFNILDKDYLYNKSYSSDFFDFIFRNTYIKEKQIVEDILETESDSD